MNGYLALSYGDRTCEIQKVRFLGHEWEGPWFLYALGSSGYHADGVAMQKDRPPEVFHSVDGVTRCWRFRSHRTVKRKMPLNSVGQGRRERVRVPVKNVFRSPQQGRIG